MFQSLSVCMPQPPLPRAAKTLHDLAAMTVAEEVPRVRAGVPRSPLPRAAKQTLHDLAAVTVAKESKDAQRSGALATVATSSNNNKNENEREIIIRQPSREAVLSAGPQL